MRVRGIFLNNLEQLLRRKLILSGFAIAVGFLLLFSWPLFKGKAALESGVEQGLGGPADAAIVSMFTAFPMAALAVVGISIILNSSLLPEEIGSGRMSFWCSHPVSRASVFIGTTASSLAVTAILGLAIFGGIVTLTMIAFPFRLSNVVEAAIAFVYWLLVPWAAVTMLSLLVRRTAAIIISFGLYGVAGFLGGLGQLGRFLEGSLGNAEDLIAAGNVGTLIMPVDSAFRAMLHGLTPVGSMMSEPLAFFGAVEQPDPWKIAYCTLWIAAALLLSLWRFRSLDLP
ncbi:hypothetical protein JW921_02020 [Candidatus Fermentibacterales bacterium]|nr:hypothetical protein [Candidatus Fermentibacterales bacterium]